MMSILDPDLDARQAEQAWRAGDIATAIETADRVLATGSDPQCLAAGVAAAAAAADGALFDAAERWRPISTALGGVPGSWAGGRAALAACLAADAEAGARDLAEACELLAGVVPRGGSPSCSRVWTRFSTPSAVMWTGRRGGSPGWLSPPFQRIP